jgi:hypothetical protein
VEGRETETRNPRVSREKEKKNEEDEEGRKEKKIRSWSKLVRLLVGG